MKLISTITLLTINFYFYSCQDGTTIILNLGNAIMFNEQYKISNVFHIKLYKECISQVQINSENLKKYDNTSFSRIAPKLKILETEFRKFVKEEIRLIFEIQEHNPFKDNLTIQTNSEELSKYEIEFEEILDDLKDFQRILVFSPFSKAILKIDEDIKENIEISLNHIDYLKNYTNILNLIIKSYYKQDIFKELLQQEDLQLIRKALNDSSDYMKFITINITSFRDNLVYNIEFPKLNSRNYSILYIEPIPNRNLESLNISTKYILKSRNELYIINKNCSKIHFTYLCNSSYTEKLEDKCISNLFKNQPVTCDYVKNDKRTIEDIAKKISTEFENARFKIISYKKKIEKTENIMKPWKFVALIYLAYVICMTPIVIIIIIIVICCCCCWNQPKIVRRNLESIAMEPHSSTRSVST